MSFIRDISLSSSVWWTSRYSLQQRKGGGGTLQHLNVWKRNTSRQCYTETSACFSLEALFERSVNLLQPFGLRLSGAAASLVSRQVGLLWLGLRLLLHGRVPHEGVTSAWNTHKTRGDKCTCERVQRRVPWVQESWFSPLCGDDKTGCDVRFKVRAGWRKGLSLKINILQRPRRFKTRESAKSHRD